MQGAVAGLLFFSAVVVIFAIVVVAKSVKVIPQAEAAVIERMGSYSRTVSGQLTLLMPFLERIRAMFPGYRGLRFNLQPPMLRTFGMNRKTSITSRSRTIICKVRSSRRLAA